MDAGSATSRPAGGDARRPPAAAPMAALLLLSLLLADDGAALRAHPPIPPAATGRRAGAPGAPRGPRTSLSYQSGSGGGPSGGGAGAVRPSERKKKGKARKKKKKPQQDAPASEEEVARHVQSALSDLPEFALEDEEEEDDEDQPCVLPGAGASVTESCRRLDRHPSLVLNADYQPLRMLPLSVWSWQNTVKAVLSGKAVVVDIYPDVYVRAVNLDMPVPSVIALREYAPVGKAMPAFTRRNVFLRDGYRCQYCGGLFRTSDLSLDHVNPRCFGGRLTWDNTVTCCKKCNGRKGCLRPAEIHQVGMRLRTEPRCPSLFELAAEATKFVPRKVHPTWAPFLGL